MAEVSFSPAPQFELFLFFFCLFVFCFLKFFNFFIREVPCASLFPIIGFESKGKDLE